MEISPSQKDQLKGMLSFLVVSIVIWVLASAFLEFPWSHTLIMIALVIVAALVQTALILFRHKKKD